MRHRQRLIPAPNKALKPYHPITPTEVRFVEEYCIDLNTEAASLRAGITPDQGFALLRKKHIQTALAMARRQRADRTMLYADEVVRRWWLLAHADAREFGAPRRVNCRHCRGLDHRYQFRDNELEEARLAHLTKQLRKPEADRVEFDDLGGGGFNGTLDPIPDCPNCDGEGVVNVYIPDSRTWSPGAVALFDGVKVSRDGTYEIKLRDRSHAADRVAEFMGVIGRVRATPLQDEIDPTKLDDEQLEYAIQRLENISGHVEGDVDQVEEGEAEEIR